MNRKSNLIAFLYIISTIGGLYFYKNIVLFFCIAVLLYIILKKKYKNLKVILFVIIIGLARAGYTSSYIDYLYNNNNENFIVGYVTKIEENKNPQKIIIKLKKMNGDRVLINTKMYVYVKDNLNEIGIGDIIAFKGNFSQFNYAKNTGNFNYKKYLQSKNIFGLVKADSVEIVGHSKINIFDRLIDLIRSLIRAHITKYLPEKNAQICCALILGEKDNIDDEMIKCFSDAGISHIIAISGMHTAYIASVMLFATKKLGKRASYFCTIIMLVIFCNMANNSESVVRATIMIVLYYISKLIHCKSDSISNLSVALLISTILNPYCIYSIGLIMSSAGTAGILKFYNEKCKDNKTNVYKKILDYTKEQIKIGFSANLALIPIIAVYYNKLSLMFVINSPIINFLLSIMMPVLILFSIGGLLHNFIPSFIHKIMGDIVTFLSNFLISIASFFQKIDILNFTIITPSIIAIVGYYLILFLIFSMRSNGNFNKKVIKKTIKIAVTVYLCVCVVSKIFSYYDNTLIIYFVDVGQGDCTCIKTPKGKTILIDGGGNESR